MNPLLLPPRLLLRALDDLHTIALAAARLSDVEERLDARFAELIALGDRIERVVLDGLVLGESIHATGERVSTLGDGLDARAEAIIAMGERLGALGERVNSRVENFDRLAEAILEQGRLVEAAGREVAETGRKLTDSLPAVERAITMAEPLEGAVERLGRMVDRLPGGGARGTGGRGSRGG